MLVVKNLPANARHLRDASSNPWVGEDSLEECMETHSIFLPAESHGQRTLAVTVHGVTKSWTQLKRLSMHSFSFKEFFLSYSCEISFLNDKLSFKFFGWLIKIKIEFIMFTGLISNIQMAQFRKENKPMNWKGGVYFSICKHVKPSPPKFSHLIYD